MQHLVHLLRPRRLCVKSRVFEDLMRRSNFLSDISSSWHPADYYAIPDDVAIVVWICHSCIVARA
jgi:hypothetical protein